MKSVIGILCIFQISALRLPTSIRHNSSLLAKEDPEGTPAGKKFLFCTTYVLNTGGMFDLLEKQFKQCDDYAFLSDFNDEKRKIFKVMDKAPSSGKQNWPIAEAMTEFLSHKVGSFDWFLKVDPDCFLRPKQMRASLAKYSPTEARAVGRPGRNGHIQIVGAVFALSGPMITKMQANKLDSAQLQKGTWHGEDTVISAWVPHAGGIVENAINAHDKCTTFSSTDRQEFPSVDDINHMKSGKSYVKVAPKKKTNMDLGDICYSADLAAIHPVKEPAKMQALMKEFDQ